MPHPYSEEADHIKRENEDPLIAARPLIIPMVLGKIAIVLLVIFVLAACSSHTSVPSFDWAGRNQSGCLEIWNSRGGSLDEAEALFNSVECIRITGPCMSSCTMALGHPNVCWSDRASFHFHRAKDYLEDGVVDSPQGSLRMYASYPTAIRVAIPVTEWTDEFTTLSAETVSALTNTELCN